MTKKQILCVDDEQTILTSLIRLFRKEDYKVHTAINGKEALSVLEETPIDLVISDYRMPGMSGIELLKEVKELYPGTIRMILSGYADFNNVVEAINEGQIYRFCNKPWDNYDFKATVRHSLEYHDILKENRILLRRLQKQNLELLANNNYLERKKNTHKFSLNIYQNILQKIPNPILIVDSTGKILLANNAAHSIFPSIRDNMRKVNINSIFNKEIANYIISLLSLDESVNTSSMSLETEIDQFSIQIEQFQFSNKIKGGILILTPGHSEQ